MFGELLAVALICAAGTSTEDCSRETAVDLIAGPAHSLPECMLQAQAAASKAGLPGGDGRYLKIVCEPRGRS
ncbi:hypothetical protein [Methylobacterium gnaphalii]|uniref:Ribosomal protein S27 n=1 Tax=Methylobacterium gnaphalii TaxID=1010610 RepID=A0A512JIQ3_9HYPH|nr:hypothetical protein [Methylobacterium gnaphalii]GEP09831.1 hypothetical protein MGN01_16760 [Methylobacterium gnaphalii]GJD67254.1 hypothetical protein MMMDOFMJ_0168 [Methylobacterium gnaphalii]